LFLLNFEYIEGKTSPPTSQIKQLIGIKDIAWMNYPFVFFINWTGGKYTPLLYLEYINSTLFEALWIKGFLKIEELVIKLLC